jgi:hypothetical protein
MTWTRMLAYITGTVDQELLLRNEYLAAENRILRTQIKGRVVVIRCRVLFGMLSLVAQLLYWSRIVSGLNQEHA